MFTLQVFDNTCRDGDGGALVGFVCAKSKIAEMESEKDRRNGKATKKKQDFFL